MEIDERLADLTPAQLTALEVLLESRSKVKAASKANVARPTVYNWINKPGTFRDIYLEAVNILYTHALDLRKQAMTTGLETLIEIAADPLAVERNRVEAAKALIQLPEPVDDDPDEGADQVHIYFPAKGSIKVEATEDGA